jgi:hypothetical protein
VLLWCPCCFLRWIDLWTETWPCRSLPRHHLRFHFYRLPPSHFFIFPLPPPSHFFIFQISEACCVAVATFCNQSPAAAAAVPRALRLAESLVRAGVGSGAELWAALASVAAPSAEITGSPLSANGVFAAASPASLGRSQSSHPSTPVSATAAVSNLSFPWN